MAESRLFKPLKIGNMEVKHRIAMAPLTRLHASDDRVPIGLMTEYYRQRAAVPGTLIISEGTLISPSAGGGFPNAPGIWSEEQIAAWRTITDAVHDKGCFIYCQLFAMGRVADAEYAKKENVRIVGPSAIPMDENAPIPQAMTIPEIKQAVLDFATAAKNAIHAGFDGVECHAANGYLTDQFIQDVSNQRDDEYGGSIENRSRFIREIMKAVVDSIGPERVGLRLSPWSLFQGMKMQNAIPQFSDIIYKARELNLAYLHMIESRVIGAEDSVGTERLDFAYKLWEGPFLVGGGYTLLDAQRLVEEEYPDREIVVVFGRYFIANPDLVYRFREGLQLNAYDRDTFYRSGSSVGYVDYPYSAEYLAKNNSGLA